MSTQFFQNQEAARKKTSQLLILYFLAVATIIGTTAIFTHVFYLYQVNAKTYHNEYQAQDYTFAAFGAIGAAFVILMGTVFKLLAGGDGEKIAELLGGVPLPPNSKDPDHRRLLNVVEEISIASGVPVPKVYLMESEDTINAFAAGFRTDKAVIGVTSGTLKNLNRDELQGVVAHEFSHILNGDMRLNLRLISVLGGIMVLATIGRILLETSSRRSSSSKKGGSPLPLFGLGLLVIGWGGVFFGRLIKATISRQREFLADASAVQFTRNPQGIGSALLKIKNEGSNIHAAYAEEASHMFFGTALNFSSFFATHPPLEDRILKIDPGLLQQGVVPNKRAPPSNEPRAAQKLTPAQAIESLGVISAVSISHAREFIEKQPESLLNSARSPDTAGNVVLAIVLSEGKAANHLFTDVVNDLAKQIASLSKPNRLSILEIAVGTLRFLTPEAKLSLYKKLNEAILADKEYTLTEFIAFYLAKQNLVSTERKPRAEPYESLRKLQQEASIFISAIVRAGKEDPQESHKTFSRAQLKATNLGFDIAFFPEKDCTGEALDKALSHLKNLKPLDKKRIFEICLEAALEDKILTQNERGLLKAICFGLEIPMPFDLLETA